MMRKKTKLNSYNHAAYLENPPTEAELKNAKRSQFSAIMAWVTINITAAVILTYIGECILKSHHFTDITDSIVLVFSAILMIVFRYEEFEVLKKFECAWALKMFQATPEGLRYLEKVQAMGREITRFDVAVAKNWANLVEIRGRQDAQEAACKELYGLKEGKTSF